MRSLLLALVPVALAGLLVGCGKPPPPQEPTAKAGAPLVVTTADVGAPLYAPVAAPTYPNTVRRNADIVIANALTQFENRQVVPAEVDGTVDVIATPVDPAEAAKLPPEQIVYLVQDRETKKYPLRKIGESEVVKAGQLLAMLDTQQVTAKLEGSQKIKESAQKALVAAGEGKTAAQKQLALTNKSVDAGGAAEKDKLEAQLTYARFVENEAQSQQTIARAEQDMAEANVLLSKHQVRSRVNGIVRSVVKRAGEYAKAGEKIMEIEATDLVRIEGQLDVQYAQYAEDAKQKGMAVIVEPAVASAQATGHTGHRQAVTGVAVTAHPEGPLVVSVGADGAALVWDPNLGKKVNRPTVPHSLPHPVAVRSVAATPADAKTMLVITGADDGRVRIWDVANPARLPSAPKAEPEDTHTTAVSAVAISPKGDFFATAAGRDVFVWNLGTVKKLYTLPAEHRDNVTAISFTPQNTLITTSKDGTLKVWKLGTEKAAVVRTLDHRAGVVEVLGVSRDGARVLFDQDKGRLDLVDPANGQTVGQIQNVTSAGSFATLALFGPGEVPANTPVDQLPPYTVVTVGGDGDLKGTLQYWQAPRTGGRGTELGRLITPGRAAITAAAFSPVRNEKFLVVGTAAGGVHLWEAPTGQRQAHTGKIVNVDATDTRYVTVRVELDNRTLKLRDKSAATVIIPANP